MTIHQIPVPAETIMRQLLLIPHSSAWPLFLHELFPMLIEFALPLPALPLFQYLKNVGNTIQIHYGNVGIILFLLHSAVHRLKCPALSGPVKTNNNSVTKLQQGEGQQTA